jgi:hypothetical protein
LSASPRRGWARASTFVNGRAWLALAVLAAAGCATAGPAGKPAGQASAAAELPLAALPTEALGTQRLLRAQYDGPEGRGGFKMVLRLEHGDRYDLSAVDGAGRALWLLQVRGGEGLFQDLAEERFCRLRTAAALPGGLGLDLPLAALPRLLLGRLPVEVPRAEAAKGSWQDGERKWAWSAPDGELTQWTLSEGGEPAVWWSRRGAEATLSVRRRVTQVRWQSSVTEPIGKPLAALVPPAGFEEGPCGVDVP